MEPDPRFWCGKRVCVTGGTGFLGYHLVSQLLAQRAEVRVLALPPRRSHPLSGLPQVACYFGDVRAPGLVQQAVAGCQVIFHTAAIVASWRPALERMYEVNVLGTQNVLAALPRDACLVHTSSITTVGAYRDATPVTEETSFNLAGLEVDYIRTKRAAEQAVLAAAARGLRVVVTNPGYLVGPDDHERSVMGRFCLRFWRGRLPVIPPGGFNLADVRDVARGHLLAAEHGRSGRRYILGGENRSTRELVERLAEPAGVCPRALPALSNWSHAILAGLAELQARLTGRKPATSLQEARLCRYFWYGRSDRAIAELGYRTRPLGETLADTYAWYAARGKIALRGLNRWWMRPEAAPRRAA